MKYYNTARTAALEAGKILMHYYSKAKIMKTKSSASDLVTQADLASEKKIKEIISKKFPSHKILAEETGLNELNSDYVWVIDPLDGTTNYFHSFPYFTVSIALYKKEKSLLGIVFAPYMKEFFHAIKGKGAFLNNKKIHVSRNNDFKKFFLATGFGYNRGKYFDLNLKNFSFFYKKCHSVRRAGSAALDLAYVAAGRFDAFFEFFLKPWDTAAGIILIKEAKGKVTNEHGEKFNPFKDKFVLASNNLKHKTLLKLVKTRVKK